MVERQLSCKEKTKDRQSIVTHFCTTCQPEYPSAASNKSPNTFAAEKTTATVAVKTVAYTNATAADTPIPALQNPATNRAHTLKPEQHINRADTTKYIQGRFQYGSVGLATCLATRCRYHLVPAASAVSSTHATGAQKPLLCILILCWSWL